MKTLSLQAFKIEQPPRYIPTRASLLLSAFLGSAPWQITFFNLRFYFISLYDLAIILGVVLGASTMLAYFTKGGLRLFCASTATSSFASLLLLSCVTGVGWDVLPVTPALEFIYTSLYPDSFALVQESIQEGTISPAHSQAYRAYEGFMAWGRGFCFMGFAAWGVLVYNVFAAEKRNR